MRPTRRFRSLSHDPRNLHSISHHPERFDMLQIRPQNSKHSTSQSKQSSNRGQLPRVSNPPHSLLRPEPRPITLDSANSVAISKQEDKATSYASILHSMKSYLVNSSRSVATCQAEQCQPELPNWRGESKQTDLDSRLFKLVELVRTKRETLAELKREGLDLQNIGRRLAIKRRNLEAEAEEEANSL